MAVILVPSYQIDSIMDNTTADDNNGGTNNIEDKKDIVTLAASFLMVQSW